ncbi:MAG: polymerase sigma-B factor [Solirubrobacterales bacterium]|nr:polymerase sigma-B factor [Solirubrobacterales bacterium]
MTDARQAAEPAHSLSSAAMPPEVSGTSLPGPNERLSDDEGLLRRFQANGDPAARQELVERYLPLVNRLAGRYRRGPEPIEDLVQVASVGLVKAIDRFDPDRGIPLASFAVPTILGELKRHFRDHGWSIHLPRDLQERILKVERTVDELSKDLGRSPSVAEIGERMGLTEEEVLEAMDAAGAAATLSLEATSAGASEEGGAIADRVGEEDPSFEVVEYGAAISDTIKSLSERDRLVLHLRFVDDLTQSQIAEEIGVSQMHVSRIIRRAVDRLRADTSEEI